MGRENRARHNIYSPSIHLSVECEHDEISFFMVADSFIIGEVLIHKNPTAALGRRWQGGIPVLAAKTPEK